MTTECPCGPSRDCLKCDDTAGNGVPPSRPTLIRPFLKYFILELAVLGAILGGLLLLHLDVTRTELAYREATKLAGLQQGIDQDIKEVVSQVRFVAHHLELDREGTEEFMSRIGIQRFLRTFTESTTTFGRVHFIDTYGLVSSYSKRGEVFFKLIEPDAPEGGDTDFFVRSLHIEPHQIMASVTNRAGDGQTKSPGKFIVRLAAGIFNSDGTMNGVVVLDYGWHGVLRLLDQANTPGLSTPMLTNKAGHFIYNGLKSDPDHLMAAPSEEMPLRLAPDLWHHIAGKRDGQFESAGTLYSFRTIEPLRGLSAHLERQGIHLVDATKSGNSDEHAWILLTTVDTSVMKLTPMLGGALPYGLLVLLVLAAALTSAFLARSEVYRKDAETALRRKHQELRRALEQERAFNILQKKFLSIVSHEFRTPLAIIDCSAQLMARSPATPDEGTAYQIATIRNAVRRLVELVQRILTASRTDAGGFTLDREPTNLAALVSEVAREQEQIAPSHRVQCNLNRLPPEIPIDRQYIHQAISNLVANAIKYSPHADRITVSAWQEDGSVHLTVADYGVGIPEDELALIFERFYRASTAKGFPGTGLGLDFVRSIVRAHGGEVTVDSVVGAGTTFHVVIPFKKPRAAGAASLEPRPPTLDAAPP